ncbi:hypothetical protein B0A65_12060 [Flavobacterium frigidimaris]|uniref:Uncharacterized protein n=1 Tax=Flavobacterium frigidimaris TaxID=262320 RepID=A0ABX4BQ96_FLAFR|nr:hypothetical protein B0A65_12060 [Flavobacterium frigidimaris]
MLTSLAWAHLLWLVPPVPLFDKLSSALFYAQYSLVILSVISMIFKVFAKKTNKSKLTYACELNKIFIVIIKPFT